MPRTPTAVKRRYNKNASEVLDDGAEEVFDMIAATVPMDKIAERFQVSRRVLYNWCKTNEEQWDAARRESADNWVEKGWQYLTTCDPTDNSTVSLAKLRSEFCWKMAEKRDREQYGDRIQTGNLTVNVNELHLSALQMLGRMDHQMTALPESRLKEIPASTGRKN